jgi:hypothetical protein
VPFLHTPTPNFSRTTSSRPKNLRLSPTLPRITYYNYSKPRHISRDYPQLRKSIDLKEIKETKENLDSLELENKEA